MHPFDFLKKDTVPDPADLAADRVPIRSPPFPPLPPPLPCDLLGSERDCEGFARCRWRKGEWRLGVWSQSECTPGERPLAPLPPPPAFPPPSCPSDTVEKEEFVAFACHELQRMKIAANPDSVDALAEGVEKAVL